MEQSSLRTAFVIFKSPYDGGDSMTIKQTNNSGKKIKCKFCKELIFFNEQDVYVENDVRYIYCNHCNNKIKLKRL